MIDRLIGCKELAYAIVGPCIGQAFRKGRLRLQDRGWCYLYFKNPGLTSFGEPLLTTPHICLIPVWQHLYYHCLPPTWGRRLLFLAASLPPSSVPNTRWSANVWNKLNETSQPLESQYVLTWNGKDLEYICILSAIIFMTCLLFPIEGF